MNTYTDPWTERLHASVGFEPPDKYYVKWRGVMTPKKAKALREAHLLQHRDAQRALGYKTGETPYFYSREECQEVVDSINTLIDE